jgi:hypothetical protein
MEIDNMAVMRELEQALSPSDFSVLRHCVLHVMGPDNQRQINLRRDIVHVLSYICASRAQLDAPEVTFVIVTPRASELFDTPALDTHH